MYERLTDEIISQTCALLAIASPTGYTQDAAQYLIGQLQSLGYAPIQTGKGGVLVDLGGQDRHNGVLLEAHLDTLGAMVAQVKSNGRLKLTPLGGLNPNNAEAENCTVITKFNGAYEGTFQLCNASLHVNTQYGKTERSFDTMELVLDEPVQSADQTRALGVETGDIVCFDPRTRVTKSGYIKSRFLDDKLSCGILLAYARYLREQNITPARRVWAHFTVFEEVGHGGSASVPQGVTEAISVDMGCVGDGLNCDERRVSICSKDSGGPYHYQVVKGLVEAARRLGLDYALDVYPAYGSDVEATLRAGNDLRHGLIGAGVYASHGYERSHRDGAKNTLMLLIGYLG